VILHQKIIRFGDASHSKGGIRVNFKKAPNSERNRAVYKIRVIYNPYQYWEQLKFRKEEK